MPMENDIYKPDWISAKDAAEWLGVSQSSLFRWRKKLGLSFSYMGFGRTLMYDKKQINEILNQNSTYSVFQKQTQKQKHESDI